MAGHSPQAQVRLNRRQLLGSCAALGSIGLAGCSTVVEFIEGALLDDVTIINGTDYARHGRIDVEDTDGESLLNEQFGLEAADADDDEYIEHVSELFEEAGTYAISISLDEDDAIKGVSEAERSIEIDPDEEYGLVFLGPSKLDDEIAIRAIEGMGDLPAIDERFEADD